MRVWKLIAATATISGIAASQYTSGPPICFAFNDMSTGSVSMVSVPFAAGALTVHFAPPISATVDALDVMSAYVFSASVLGVDLYSTVSLGGATSGPPIASMSGGSLVTGAIGGPAWFRLVPSTPIPLTGGATYALLIRSFAAGPSSACVLVGFDAAGTYPLPYQLAGSTGSAVCPAVVPASGQLPFSLRFRGAACGPGPQASVTPLGNSCGTLPSLTGLFTTMPPMLGYQWLLTAVGPYNETAYLFWSIGVIPSGSPIPGSACLQYLDPVSLQSLFVLGAEPLASGPLTTPYGGASTAPWAFMVPANPSLAGAIIGVQALVVGPTGSIPLGGGMLGQVTNALVLTLGY